MSRSSEVKIVEEITHQFDKSNKLHSGLEQSEFKRLCMICTDLFDKEEIDIGGEFGSCASSDCKGLILSHYLNAKRPEEIHNSQNMQIRLTSDVPFYCSPRRLSYYEKEEVTKILDELLNKDIIRPSDSPYASPIVLVKKKTGELRMCVDYRGLNKIMVRDNYPLPLIEDCLDYLEGKSCFSILDLKNGFHQVNMAPDSIKYTSFVTPQGQFEYVKMPFGLKNGPSVFQRFINNALRDLIRNNKIIVYLDDILIATKTVEEHLVILKELFKRLVSNRLEVKLSKCKFLYRSIDYLGYNASSQGIRPNDFHINTIKNYPMPRNFKELQSCMGLLSYFRKFVPNFSRLAIPLLNILKKDKMSFKLDRDCETAFYTLKEKIVSGPVLAIYNPKRETELHTDASQDGFGSILQKQDDKKLHPVSYYSKGTTQAEKNYHSFELETLAIVYSVRRFHVYLQGIKFKIVTDCNALAQTLAKKNVNTRIARWALELENYDFTIEHRKGLSMGHVDALSRTIPVFTVTSDEIDLHIQATQSRDRMIVELRDRLEEEEVKYFELKDGLVFRKIDNDRLAFYVPSEMEENVIRLIHEKIGHLGVDKCLEQMKHHYWFPSMRAKIEMFIKNCIKCIMHNAPVHINERTLHSIPKVPEPFHTLHIDHMGPLPNVVNKKHHLLVIIDSFTKFTKLYPANTTSTKEVCASLDKYFDYYSRPKRLVSDRGSCFMSLEFAKFCKDRNIEHIKVATAAPQANGQVERINRIITPMLGKISEPINQSDWSRLLNRVEYALNNTTSSSTKQTASILLFGVAQRGPEVDELTEYLIERLPKTRLDFDKIRVGASEQIEKSQRQNEVQYAKRSFPPAIYKEGDFVVIRNVDTTVGRNKKLIPKYKGPYVIHKVLENDRYVIRDIENCQLTQLPYNGVLEAARLKLWKKAKDDLIALCMGGRDNK